MRHELNSWSRVGACVFVAAGLLLLAAADSGARGQSGRRATKPATTVETAPPSSSTGEGEGSKQPAVKFKLFVACEMPANAGPRAATIFNKFVMRLAESPMLTVESLGILKRDAAVRRAKEESEAYVVLLDLEKDSFQNGNIMVNAQDLKVTYNVYAPGTAQSKAKGKVYYQAMGGGGKRSGGGLSDTPIKITPEAAGIEAAEMLLEWFSRVEGRPLQVQKD